MSALPYNLPNLVKVLLITDQSHQEEAIIISQLIADVESGLEAIQEGGKHKWFCDPKTFDRYRIMTRETTESKYFTRAMKAIKEPAFKLIVGHLEKMHPGITK